MSDVDIGHEAVGRTEAALRMSGHHEKAATLRDLRAALDAAEAERDALRARVETMDAEHSAERRGWNEMLNKARDLKNKLVQERDALRAQVEDLEARVHGHRAAAFEASVEIEALQHKVGKFMWQVRDTCVRAEKAEAALATARREAAAEMREAAEKAVSREWVAAKMRTFNFTVNGVLKRIRALPLPGDEA